MTQLQEQGLSIPSLLMLMSPMPMPTPPIIIGLMLFMPMPVLAIIWFILPVILRLPEAGQVTVLATVLTSAFLVAALVLAAAALPFSFSLAA